MLSRALLPLVVAAVAAVAAPLQLLFEAGQPPSWGINNYRIPSLVATSRGTLVAVAEARTTDKDCTHKWLAFRRSTDNGTSWGPITELYGRALPQDQGFGNPVLVFDAVTSTIILHASVNDPRACNPTRATLQITDGGSDGVAWGAPTPLNPFLGPWAGATPGPGAGLQVPPGAPHAGRLLNR